MAHILSRDGTFTLIERRSQFCARAFRLATPTDLQEALAAARSAFPSAGHHTFAMRLTPGVERCSDDGEPQGTAGRPCLTLLEQMDLVEAAVIVSRTFGGTKLGYGGLVRAYRGAAKEALKEAQPTPLVDTSQRTLSLSHAEWAQAEVVLRDYVDLRTDAVFMARVDLTLRGETERLRACLLELQERLRRPVDSDL